MLDENLTNIIWNLEELSILRFTMTCVLVHFSFMRFMPAVGTDPSLI